MKYFFVFILFVGSQCMAQDKDSSVSFSIGEIRLSTGYVNFTTEDHYGVYISIPDSNISIEGDTMKVIKMLLQHIYDYQKIEQEYDKFVSVAVDFSNQVPDIWKSKEHNCKWSAYNSLLKKKGYRTVKIKTPSNPCK